MGIFIGANMADVNTGANDLYKSIFKFRQVLTHIENDYVDKVNTDELVENAITEMLAKLDPHSVYIPAKELALSQSQLEGNFEGIGVEFNIFKDTIVVVSALSGGPSESLGIQSGDKIISVNDASVAGIGIDNRKVIELLRGPKGSKVKVTIERKGQRKPLDFQITRNVIPQHSMDVAYMINDEVGYIKISRFSATTYMEFKEGLNKLQNAGMKKLVLDLTGNPGGYMEPAVKMVDELLDGNRMIVYTMGKESRHNSQYQSQVKGDFEQGPVIVLIDEGSASASEIVSGALQDHDRALIVGRRSFGKGLVQLPINLNDGSAMRLTISRYYTPSGRSIQKPYNGSLEEYHQEFTNRFNSGEVFKLDSSMYAHDSLIYRTAKGRVVYGGGGIMPDYFVPIDTSANTFYMTRLFNSNSVAEYALKYTEGQRNTLEKMSLKKYIQDFEVTDEMLAELIALGKANGVLYNATEFERSRASLRGYVKAHIARTVWKNDGFYPIFNEQNEVLQEALHLFDEANRLASKN